MKRTVEQRIDAFHKLRLYYWKQIDIMRVPGKAKEMMSTGWASEYDRLYQRMELAGYCIRRLMNIAGHTGGSNLPPQSFSDLV